ncbi:aromatic compound dioxygenase [Zopfia rhizophila CBS 207.26]|uniref:Aromatic compound dioxygenase n=1 Tax=Zopfia rhizophila CBS 207.26 TaxID=1314779 RepID=A0A6A6DIP7_9PEZI|nr:aromatic compound dioxygenase [Zopfia rhizophila CBS 207.26]
MVNLSYLASAVAASSLVGVAIAHPGESHDPAALKREIEARNIMAKHARRSMNQCAGSLKHRELMQRSYERRAKTLQALREKRGITAKSRKFRRDLATLQSFEAVNHNMTGLDDYTTDTPASTIFSANTSYILAPEVTDGPYYVLGELIRQDVKEDQFSDGVDLYLDVQYLDVTTCEPVEGLYIDIWNANATGVYSGIVATGNSDSWDTTYLRGVQATDADGVATFETIFPGHYEGRATHTHLLTHSNVTLNDNNTFSGGAVTHIGQLFYPEDLRSAVEAVEPYNTNTQAITTNDDDMWSIVQAEDDYDPFPEFIYLGDDISDGLMAWIQIGINTTADYTDDDYYSVAAVLAADSGHSTGNSVGGGEGGNGTMPSGSPSGAIPSGAIPAASGAEAIAESSSSSAISSSKVAIGSTPAPSPSGKPSGNAPSGLPSRIPSSGAMGSDRPVPTVMPSGPKPSGMSAGPRPSDSARPTPSGARPSAKISAKQSGSLPPPIPSGEKPTGSPPSGIPPSGTPRSSGLSAKRVKAAQQSGQGPIPSGQSPPPSGAPQPTGPPPSGSPPSGAPTGLKPTGPIPSGSPLNSMPPSGSPPSGAPTGLEPTGPIPSGARPSGKFARRQANSAPHGSMPSGPAPSGPPPSGAPLLPSGAPPSGPAPSGPKPTGPPLSGVPQSINAADQSKRLSPSGPKPSGPPPSGASRPSEKKVARQNEPLSTPSGPIPSDAPRPSGAKPSGPPPSGLPPNGEPSGIPPAPSGPKPSGPPPSGKVAPSGFVTRKVGA